QPDFSVSVSPSSQSVLQGGTTGNYTATSAPIGGFAGAVAWAMSALPAGLTSSAISSSGTFTLTAASTMAPGTCSVTVTGTSGRWVHTATASVVVTSNANFALSLSQTSLTIKRGSSGTFT